MNIPNLLTSFRLVIIPIFIATYYSGYIFSNLICVALFTVACITDWFDGYIARSLNQETRFGAFFDPVADKLLVASAFIVLIQQENSIYFTIPVLIILSREIFVSALREWMAIQGASSKVSVSLLAKIKTTFQMVTIILFLINIDFFKPYIDYLEYFLLYGSVVLSIKTMYAYFKAAIPNLS